jgi:hypothetical protein
MSAMMREGGAMGSARRTQPFPALSVGFFVAALLVAGPVSAQTPTQTQTHPSRGGGAVPAASATAGSVTVTPQPSQPQPRPEFGFENGLPPEQGSPREEDHGERTRTIYQPAFVRGAVKTTRTSQTSGVRYGLSGWTAPRIPFDDRESSGFPAIGITIEWGVPMEPPAEPAKPGQR